MPVATKQLYSTCGVRSNESSGAHPIGNGFQVGIIGSMTSSSLGQAQRYDHLTSRNPPAEDGDPIAGLEGS